MTYHRIEDEVGRRIAARLSAGTEELPHEVTERLRAARAQAMTQRKRVSAQIARSSVHSGGEVSLDPEGQDDLSWWRRLASVLPVLALAVGLVAVSVVQSERRASELAEVDAALLTDTLPPSAYSDPGFQQFLKSGR